MVAYDRRATWSLRAFAWWRIPLIAWLRPRVVIVSPQRTEIVLPLSRRSRNHLGSMYFGALCVGADLACGALAMNLIREHQRRTGQAVSLVFKDVRGDFLRRPDGDVHFVVDQGGAVSDLVERAAATQQRHDLPVDVVCFVPKTGPEPVARFTLTLSLKGR